MNKTAGRFTRSGRGLARGHEFSFLIVGVFSVLRFSPRPFSFPQAVVTAEVVTARGHKKVKKIYSFLITDLSFKPASLANLYNRKELFGFSEKPGSLQNRYGGIFAPVSGPLHLPRQIAHATHPFIQVPFSFRRYLFLMVSCALSLGNTHSLLL